MIPRKELNIYPRNKRNVQAIIEYFFNKINLPDGGDLYQLFKDNNLSINQIEFVVRIVSEQYEFFKKKGSLRHNPTKYEFIRLAIFYLLDPSQKDKQEDANDFFQLITEKETATALA